MGVGAERWKNVCSKNIDLCLAEEGITTIEKDLNEMNKISETRDLCLPGVAVGVQWIGYPGCPSYETRYI